MDVNPSVHFISSTRMLTTDITSQHTGLSARYKELKSTTPEVKAIRLRVVVKRVLPDFRHRESSYNAV